MNQIVVITAVGQDRPGIVAGLAKAMYDLGGNLNDATMTRLHSIFATMVSASLPGGKSVDDCRAALAPVGEGLGLTISVQPVDADSKEITAPDHMLTVYGADQPGIVYHVAMRLADLGINITDMDTRMAGSPESPIYIMLLEVSSGDLDLPAALHSLRQELKVDITIQALGTEAL